MLDFSEEMNDQIEIGIAEQQDEEKDDSVKIGAGFAATESARASTQAAAQKFAKPSRYDRSILDDSAAKRNIKNDAFKSGVTVKDPYTGDVLNLTKAEAQTKYGGNWTKHLAEADHKISLEQRYERTKDNPWLTNEDIRASSNSSDNLEVVSRKFNNAKRSRSNEEFVTDDEYLRKAGVKLSEQGKEKAIQSEKMAQKALDRQDFRDSTRNMIQTGHDAGVSAAKNAGTMGLAMSGIMNMTAVIQGEKSAEDAIADTVIDTGKAAAAGYVMGNSLTTISHTLSGTSSEFLQAIAESEVLGKLMTAVMLTRDIFKRYANGKITTQECFRELGKKGLDFAATGYSMAVGQALIPIPFFGAAFGVLVGSKVRDFCEHLIATLQMGDLEHQERLRIIEECERAAQAAREFREELEGYLKAYFQDHQDCFDDAFTKIKVSLWEGDADEAIAGINQITRKLGGNVPYNNMDEFRARLWDDSTDRL
jgi:hypothetical protein